VFFVTHGGANGFIYVDTLTFQNTPVETMAVLKITEAKLSANEE